MIQILHNKTDMLQFICRNWYWFILGYGYVMVCLI